MPRYNDYVIERVAEALWEHNRSDAVWDDTFPNRPWEEAPVAHTVPYYGMARAALEAIDSLYESEAEQPVEYAGIEGGL